MVLLLFYRRRCCISFCSIWYCLEEQTRLILQTQIDLTPQRNKPSLACCPLALRLFLFNTWSDTEWCQCHCCQWRNIGYKTVRRPLIGLNHSEPFWTILNHSEPFYGDLKHTKTDLVKSPNGQVGSPNGHYWSGRVPKWSGRVLKWYGRVPKWYGMVPKWSGRVPKND